MIEVTCPTCSKTRHANRLNRPDGMCQNCVNKTRNKSARRSGSDRRYAVTCQQCGSVRYLKHPDRGAKKCRECFNINKSAGIEVPQKPPPADVSYRVIAGGPSAWRGFWRKLSAIVSDWEPGLVVESKSRDVFSVAKDGSLHRCARPMSERQRAVISAYSASDARA